MQGYLSNVLRRGAKPAFQPVPRYDLRGVREPLQVPSASQIADYCLQLEPPVGLSRHDAGESIKVQPIPPSSLAEYRRIEALAEHNQSDLEVPGTFLSGSVETTPMLHTIAFDKLGTVASGQADAIGKDGIARVPQDEGKEKSECSSSTAYSRTEGSSSSESRKNVVTAVNSNQPATKSQVEESPFSALPTTFQPAEDKKIAVLFSSVPTRQNQQAQVAGIKVPVLRPGVELHSVTEVALSPISHRQVPKGQTTHIEVTDLQPALDLPSVPERSVVTAVHSSQQEPNRTPKVSETKSANEPPEVLSIRPPITAKTAREVPEIAPAQKKENFLRGAMSKQDVLYHETTSPKLTINRLDIQIVNQNKETPVQPIPRVQRPASSFNTWEELDRHHLGHFYLTF